jgi:hypothetical protein
MSEGDGLGRTALKGNVTHALAHDCLTRAIIVAVVRIQFPRRIRIIFMTTLPLRTFRV